MSFNRWLKLFVMFALLVGGLSMQAAQPRPATANGPAQQSTGNVYWWWMPTENPVGTSMVVRNNSGVSATLKTTEISAGHTLTLWIVVFNNPEHCLTTPCSDADFGVEAVGADFFYAAGNVVGGNGVANFGGHLMVGDTSKSGNPFFDLEPVGLLNPLTAEIHLVVRSHGPAIPGQVNEQINSFDGGCTVFLDPPLGPEGVPDEEGECADIQFATHLP